MAESKSDNAKVERVRGRMTAIERCDRLIDYTSDSSSSGRSMHVHICDSMADRGRHEQDAVRLVDGPFSSVSELARKSRLLSVDRSPPRGRRTCDDRDFSCSMDSCRRREYDFSISRCRCDSSTHSRRKRPQRAGSVKPPKCELHATSTCRYRPPFGTTLLLEQP
jgi:hypothetical protein